MAYSQSTETGVVKPLGTSNMPTDGRTYFHDLTNFTYRPFVSTAEVLAYLDTAAKRKGHFGIIINTGGTLANGLITGGTNDEYWFKDGVADGNLVAKASGNGNSIANGTASQTADFNISGTGSAQTIQSQTLSVAQSTLTRDTGNNEMVFKNAAHAANVLAIQNTDTSDESYSVVCFRNNQGVEHGAIGYGNASNAASYPWNKTMYLEAFEGADNSGIPPIRIVQTRLSGGYLPFRRLEFLGNAPGAGPGNLVIYDASGGYPNEKKMAEFTTDGATILGGAVRNTYASTNALDETNKCTFMVQTNAASADKNVFLGIDGYDNNADLITNGLNSIVNNTAGKLIRTASISFKTGSKAAGAETGYIIFRAKPAAGADVEVLRINPEGLGQTRICAPGTNDASPGQLIIQSNGVGTDNQFIDFLKQDGTLNSRIAVVNGVLEIQSSGFALENLPITTGETYMLVKNSTTRQISRQLTNTPMTDSYAPTATGLNNIASAVFGSGHFYKNGNMVTCFGMVTVQATAAGSAYFEAPLPFSSTFSNIGDCAGTAATGNNRSLAILADITSNKAQFLLTAVDTASYIYSYQFSYLIV